MKRNMRTPQGQRGIGWFGLLLIFGVVAFAAIVAVKVGPLYLNQFTVARILHGVANDPELANSDAAVIRDRMQRRWDIDYVTQLEPKDVKIKRTERGRVLAYDYEARVKLFYNVFIVINFKDEVPMRNVESSF